ncbi:hypothetical protein [Streptomyces sp. NPDC093568]|uniref:hypothetical protein n=1 Tax=Streptomyces sp. NPDC093568 TaxID=3366041 RepID=UPI0038301687
MQKRTAALIAGASAAVAMTITGVTYASADAPQSASSVREAVPPASAPLGGDSDYDYKKDYRHGKKDHGTLQINERTYSENPGACVAVVRPLGTSFNITNNTDRIVQFFAGDNCNAGNPVATVLPGGNQFGVIGTPTSSFRLID